MNIADELGNGAELAGESLLVRSLTDYLHNSHGYFLDFRLPAIRRKLIEAVDCAQSDVSFAIMRFFDEYAAEVQRHMSYEEQTVFRMSSRCSRARRTRPIRSTFSAASTTRSRSSCAS